MMRLVAAVELDLSDEPARAGGDTRATSAKQTNAVANFFMWWSPSSNAPMRRAYRGGEESSCQTERAQLPGPGSGAVLPATPAEPIPTQTRRAGALGASPPGLGAPRR